MLILTIIRFDVDDESEEDLDNELNDQEDYVDECNTCEMIY